MIVFGRVLTGLFGSSYSPVQAVVADGTTPDDRATTFGRVSAAFAVGVIAAPVAASRARLSDGRGNDDRLETIIGPLLLVTPVASLPDHGHQSISLGWLSSLLRPLCRDRVAIKPPARTAQPVAPESSLPAIASHYASHFPIALPRHPARCHRNTRPGPPVCGAESTAP